MFYSAQNVQYTTDWIPNGQSVEVANFSYHYSDCFLIFGTIIIYQYFEAPQKQVVMPHFGDCLFVVRNFRDPMSRYDVCWIVDLPISVYPKGS